MTAFISLNLSKSNKLILFRRGVPCRLTHFAYHQSLLFSIRVRNPQTLADCALKHLHGGQQGALNLSLLLHLITLYSLLSVQLRRLIYLNQLLAWHQLLL